MLITKSTCVTSGKILNLAITVTVTRLCSEVGVFDDAQKTEEVTGVSQASGIKLFVTFLAFVIVLYATAYFSRQIHVLHFVPERFKKTYEAGLGLIPAWQWTGVVKVLLTLTLGSKPLEEPRLRVTIVVLTISFLTAAFQVLLEHLANHDKATLTFAVVDKLRTSLGAGIGFSVNMLSMVLIGGGMHKSILLMSCYFCGVTCLVALLQFFGFPLIESKKEEWPKLLVRTCRFLLTACNFVVAFALKDLVTLIVGHHFPEGVLGALLASLAVTVVLCFVVVLMTITEVHLLMMMLPGLEDLCKLVCAMNIGWSWATFALACLHWWESRNNEALEVGHIWLFAFLTVTIASIVAVFLQFVFQKFEPAEAEEELPLKSK